MNFTEFMEKYAQEIDGQFSEYDDTKSVITVPLKDQRFQAVKGVMKRIGIYDKLGIEFSSRVAPYKEDIELKELLEENTKFCHAKFSVINDFIHVEASAYLDNVTDDLLKEIIQEVAQVADEWEFKITGQDVH